MACRLFASGSTAQTITSSAEIMARAFVAITPFDQSAPDDIPDRLRDIGEIEACYSVAGEANYLLKARVAAPGDLEALLGRIRAAAGVSTHTTIVLSTPWE